MSEVLERGDIYFLYRPKVEQTTVEGFDDVQRLYMVLKPAGRQRFRVLAVGRKRLPAVKNGGNRYWAFVEKVAGRPEELGELLGREVYQTPTRGARVQPPARPAGEGVYALVRHGDHTHLAYALELPETPGAVQETLNIEEEASYIISVKNPDAPAPGPGRPGGNRKVDLPERLKKVFRGRRFADADPPELLDHAGAEVVLVGAREDASQELDIDLDPEQESRDAADVFQDLRLRRDQRTTTPLTTGEWR